MREAYGVSAKDINDGFLCTCKEFDMENFPIHGDSLFVYDELKKILKKLMVFDITATYLFRAPYEERITPLDNADTVFLISFNPDELKVGQGT